MLEHSGGGSHHQHHLDDGVGWPAADSPPTATAKAATGPTTTRLAALDLLPTGVRVNALAPGSIATSALDIVASNDEFARADGKGDTDAPASASLMRSPAAASVFGLRQRAPYLTGKVIASRPAASPFPTSTYRSRTCDDGYSSRPRSATGNVGVHAFAGH